jgi:hypothetical protein
MSSYSYLTTLWSNLFNLFKLVIFKLNNNKFHHKVININNNYKMVFEGLYIMCKRVATQHIVVGGGMRSILMLFQILNSKAWFITTEEQLNWYLIADQCDNEKLIIKRLLGWFCRIWLRLQKQVLHLIYGSMRPKCNLLFFLFLVK